MKTEDYTVSKEEPDIPEINWEELQCDDCGMLVHDMAVEQKKWYFFCVAEKAFSPSQARGIGEFLASTYNKRISDDTAALFPLFCGFDFSEKEITQLIIYSRILKKIFALLRQDQEIEEKGRIVQHYLHVFCNNASLDKEKLSCLARLAHDVYQDKVQILKGKKGRSECFSEKRAFKGR